MLLEDLSLIEPVQRTILRGRRSLQDPASPDNRIGADSHRVSSGSEQFLDSIPAGPRLYAWMSGGLYFARGLADSGPDNGYGSCELLSSDETDHREEEEDPWDDGWLENGGEDEW